MEIIKRFLTLIETEKDQNIKTDLIHNMYFHIFDLDLVKQVGIFSISQNIKKYETQGVNMSFWKAKLAKVSWIPSFYISVKNINKRGADESMIIYSASKGDHLKGQ